MNRFEVGLLSLALAGIASSIVAVFMCLILCPEQGFLSYVLGIGLCIFGFLMMGFLIKIERGKVES